MSSYDFIGFPRISWDFIDFQRISEPWTRPESLHAFNALKSNRGASLIIRTATFIGTLPKVPTRFRYPGEKSEAWSRPLWGSSFHGQIFFSSTHSSGIFLMPQLFNGLLWWAYVWWATQVSVWEEVWEHSPGAWTWEILWNLLKSQEIPGHPRKS